MTSNDIVRVARGYLGKPYVWGGESEAEGGYDCSGFVFSVLNKCGMKVPRTTAQGYSVLGKKVSNIQSGDLLFFGKSTKRITHIAIAINSTQMIESRGNSKNTKTNKGKGVSITNISHRSDLVLVKRIVDFEKEKITAMSLLKRGTKNNDVTVFEILMSKLGYYTGSIDSAYGKGCVSACINFQREHNLLQDGECGNNTWKALLSEVI
ncbi:MAG: peptidoglycan hydrolase [Bacteriophage sp.]|nr:MAG: peptidoglycan hydrolase [Bacteriophage sp.]